MAEAKKCDRCGALYEEHYNAASMNIDNGESVIYIIARYGNRKLDLCEECTKLFEQFMNNTKEPETEVLNLNEPSCYTCKHRKKDSITFPCCECGDEYEYYEEDKT